MLHGLVEALPGSALQLDLLCNDPLVCALWQTSGLPSTLSAHAVTLNISLEETFDAWTERRTKQLRKNIRRYEARASAEGIQLSLQVHTDLPNIAAAVERYIQLEDAGWKGKEGTSLGSIPEQRRFYEDLFAELGAEKRGLVYELWANERLAASRLVIHRGQMVVILKTAFDEDLREWAPGRVLFHKVIEDAFKRWPQQSLELYTNATQDQLSWIDNQRTIHHLTLFRSAAIKLLIEGLVKIRGSLSRKIEEERLSTELETLDPFVTLRADESELLNAYEKRHFQLGSSWWQIYQQTVMQNSSGARIFCLRRGNRLVAILPANVDQDVVRFGGTVGSLSNYYTSLYSPLIVAGSISLDLLPLINRLRDESGQASSLTFQPMNPSSNEYQALRGALELCGYSVFSYACQGNWLLTVDTSWQEYLERRPPELRNTIRRHQKKLVSAGGVAEIISQGPELERAILAFEQVYARSWKRAEPFSSFIPTLARSYADRGCLRLGVIWLGDSPIAAQIWIVLAGRAAIYKLAYDDDFKRYGAGTVLTAELMRHCIEVDKVHEVDFLTGDEPFKSQWMSLREDRVGIVAHRSDSADGLLRTAREHASRLFRRVRPKPQSH